MAQEWERLAGMKILDQAVDGLSAPIVAELNCDDRSEVPFLCGDLDIGGIPVLALYKGGKEIGRYTGQKVAEPMMKWALEIMAAEKRKEINELEEMKEQLDRLNDEAPETGDVEVEDVVVTEVRDEL